MGRRKTLRRKRLPCSVLEPQDDGNDAALLETIRSVAVQGRNVRRAVGAEGNVPPARKTVEAHRFDRSRVHRMPRRADLGFAHANVARFTALVTLRTRAVTPFERKRLGAADDEERRNQANASAEPSVYEKSHSVRDCSRD